MPHTPVETQVQVSIAILGSSMVCTRLPSPIDGKVLRFAGDADPIESSMKLLMEADWRYGFHWEDVPEHLVSVDVASKPPTFGAVAPWGSATVPNIGARPAGRHYAGSGSNRRAHPYRDGRARCLPGFVAGDCRVPVRQRPVALDHSANVDRHVSRNLG